MRILFVVPYTPTAIRVRPYSFVRFLAQRGHTVILATLWESEAEQQALQKLRADGIQVMAAPLNRSQKLRNVLRAWQRGLPIQAAFCESPQLLDQIQQFLRTEPVDVIHVEHLRGAAYGLALLRQQTAPVVWDSVDCITHLFEQAASRSRSLTGRLMTGLELPRTRRYESSLPHQFKRVLVTSINDQAALQQLAQRGTDIQVVTNGVDLDYFAPDSTPYTPDTVVYSGKMSYHANVTAALFLAEQIMPLVWRHKPNARLVIAGSKPTQAIQQLTQDARIQVTGYVEDLRQPLLQAAVAVAPLLYGAGIQNKVLEAMACGTPVVATSQAVSALAIRPGQDCLVADNNDALAISILEVLNNGTLRARLSQQGRRFVETHHDWQHIIAQLERHYQDVQHDAPHYADNRATSIGGEYSYVQQLSNTPATSKPSTPMATHAQSG